MNNGAPLQLLMLSYEYWIRSFGGDHTVVNKTFTMNDKLHTVIGILPPVPQYPTRTMCTCRRRRVRSVRVPRSSPTGNRA